MGLTTRLSNRLVNMRGEPLSSGKKHRRNARNRTLRDPNKVPYVGFCTEHNKKAFTRANAKKTIRVLCDSGMRRFRCRATDLNWWHVGHMPKSVKRGTVTASEIYEQQGVAA